MKTCVLIPTYNESLAIGWLVEDVRKKGLEVVVIDDGSTDNTYGIAKNKGATVFKNEANRGKGASLLKGFRYAVNNGFDAIVTMDGDGQHLPDDIDNFISAAKKTGCAVITGNRMQSLRNMPAIRVITNKFMSWLISVIAGQDIPDTQCGFRLIKTEALKKIELRTARYETESELLIKASRLGFRIASIPINTVYADEKSGINPFIDTLRFIRFTALEICSDAE